jgi:hypothetical protein
VSAIGLHANQCRNDLMSAGSIETHIASANGLREGGTAQPDAIEGRNVSRYNDIDVEPGILQTDGRACRLDYEPIVALRRIAQKIELDQ